jgi:hypothetical protein
MTLWVNNFLSNETNTSGGLRLKLVKELAVMPMGESPCLDVTTVTPEANCPMARLKSEGSKVIEYS